NRPHAGLVSIEGHVLRLLRAGEQVAAGGQPMRRRLQGVVTRPNLEVDALLEADHIRLGQLAVDLGLPDVVRVAPAGEEREAQRDPGRVRSGDAARDAGEMRAADGAAERDRGQTLRANFLYAGPRAIGLGASSGE